MLERRKVIRGLLIVLAAVIAVPAMPSGDQSTAGASQRKKKKQRRTNSAARRRQLELQQRRLLEARRKSAQQEEARKSANRKAAAKKSAEKKKPSTSERKPDTEVHVSIKSWKETQEFIGKQKGKVVVVDFWASWCKPCIKELPELVALQKKHPKDVVTISYNLDNDGTEDLKKKVVPNVLKTLKGINAINVRNIVSSDTDEQTYKLTKLDSVPAILVFDRDGKLHKRIDVNSAGGKDVSYEKHVVPVVDKLVKSKKP